MRTQEQATNHHKANSNSLPPEEMKAFKNFKYSLLKKYGRIDVKSLQRLGYSHLVIERLRTIE